jgi:hypothetical protein
MIKDDTYGPLYAGPRTLPDGSVAYVTPLTYGRARINVGDEYSVHSGY